MYNTYLASRISLRTTTTRASPFSYNNNDYYSHGSNDRHPFPYSSSRTFCYSSSSSSSCYCCCNNNNNYNYSVCKVGPISPSYCYSLYGVRQSSLLQLPPCRKLVSGCGFDRRCYARLPVCDVDRRCGIREGNVGGRKGGLRKCMVFEEMSGDECVDEVEVLLGLLTEDVGEECVRVRKETGRIGKKPLVGKRGNGEVSKKCGSEKKRVEYESVGFGSRNRDDWREERIRREDERDESMVYGSRYNDNRRDERIRREDERDESMVHGSRYNDNRRDERIRREDELDESMVYGSRYNDNRRDERIRREDERDESRVYGSRNNDYRRDERIRREDVRDESRVYGSRNNDYRRDERIRREDVRDESRVYGSRNNDYRKDERIRREDVRDESVAYKSDRREERIRREDERDESRLYGSRYNDYRGDEKIRREDVRDESMTYKSDRREERIRREDVRDESVSYKSDRREGRIRREDVRDELVAYKSDRRDERTKREEERDESMVFDSRRKDNRRDERIRMEEERDELQVYKDNRREERIRREEEREALVREQNQNAMLREENKYLLASQTKREKAEREESLRKSSHKDETRQENEAMLEREKWNVRARREGSETYLTKGSHKDERKQEKESMLEREKWNLKARGEESESLLRKAKEKDEKDEKKQEKESTLEREKWNVRARTEEREDLLRREEHRHKMRKDGSGSSYYSVSSTGDYDSDNEIELSSGYNRDSRTNEMVKRKNEKEITAGSSVVESDFRKKSEKKLSDVSVVEVESRKEMLQKSKLSVDHDNNNKKSYDYYVGNDDRKVKSKENMRFDEERMQKHKQSGDELRQHNQLEMKGSRNDGIKYSSGYQEISEIQEIDPRKTLISQQEIDRRKASVSQHDIDRRKTSISEQEIDLRKTSVSQHDIDLRKTSVSQHDIDSRKTSISDQEIDLRKTSVAQHDIDLRKTSISQQEIDRRKTSISQQEIDLRKTSVSQEEIDLRKTRISQQDIDLRKTSTSQQGSDFRKTSISQQGIEASAMKKEDYSTNLLSSINDAYHQVSGLVESSGNSQQISKKEGTSVLKRQSDSKLVKRDENVNLAYGSYLESKEERSQKQAKINRTNNPGNGSSELAEMPSTHSGEFGSIDVDDKKKTKLEVLVRPSSSGLPERGEVPVETNVGMATNEGSYGSLQFDSPAALHGENLEISQGQSSKFISQEDAISSAARLERSSARYVDDFVDNVKNDILGSEIHREEETNETKLLHEEQPNEKALVQYTSGGRKGPSVEMWDVDEQSVKQEVQQEDASRGGKAIFKRTGKSLWNVFTDIVRLRWSPRSESHSSGGRTGSRGSPNQSTSSGTWHEAEEHERSSITPGGSSSSQQEGKTLSRVEVGPSSSTSVGPSSSSAEILETSTPPRLKMTRSPVVRRVSETEEENASGSGLSELQTTVSVGPSESSVSEQELKQNKLLKRKDQVITDRFEEWEEAYRFEAEQQKIDEMFMREALLEARKAADNWEVPIGAVLVQNGKIIARGCNLVEELRDSTAHAEMICIREASNALRSWRLSGTTLYVTLEPCPMCAGAILQARIDTVVWGAPNRLLGADGSWIRLFPNGDVGNESEQTDKPAPPVHPFHPKIIIRRRVLASECADAMQQFFQLRRKKNKEEDQKPDPPNPSPRSRLHISHHPSKFMTKMHDAFHFMFCL